VHVVDKELFLASRVVDVLLTEPSYAAGTRLAAPDRPATLALFRAGRRHTVQWLAFLDALAVLLRTKRRRRSDTDGVAAFLRTRDDLLVALRADAGASAGLDVLAGVDVLAGIRRERVARVVARIAEGDRSVPPPLEPLLPALAETVLFWSGGTRRVRVVHDEQSALTADRLRRLQDSLAVTMPGSPSPLAALVTVDSRDDPRVQVADLLAGVARRSADVLADPLLRPFLSPTSLIDPLYRPGTGGHHWSDPSVGAGQ
jgi:hypothetical protein